MQRIQPHDILHNRLGMRLLTTIEALGRQLAYLETSRAEILEGVLLGEEMDLLTGQNMFIISVVGSMEAH